MTTNMFKEMASMKSIKRLQEKSQVYISKHLQFQVTVGNNQSLQATEISSDFGHERGDADLEVFGVSQMVIKYH